MVTKKYGVRGMMEWYPLIQVGNTRKRIPFEGGARTAYGVRDATYTTSNKVVQFCIERSGYFREGRIRLLATYGGEEEAAQSTGETSTGDASSSTKAAKRRRVDVSDIDEARQYLIDECGVDGMRLTSKSAVLSAAKSAGVQFNGI